MRALKNSRTPVILALLCALLVAIPAHADDTGNNSMKFKMATIAPKGVGWAIHFENIILPEVKEVVGDQIKVKIFWGGVMGSEEESIKKMRKGLLQGAGLSGQGSTLICPESAVVELPFLFNNYKEVDYIKEKMTPTFDKLFRESGFFLFAWCDQDFDIIISPDKAFTKLEDFRGTPFMTWYGPLEERLLTKLGAELVPLDVPQIAPSAQAGKFKAAIGPVVFVVGAQLHNIVRHINPCQIRYSPSLMVLTNAAWDSIPERYHKDFYEKRAPLTKAYCSKVREENAQTLEALYKYGIQKDEFTPVELTRLKRRTRGLWDDMVGTLYSQELLDQVLMHLKEFRANNPG